MRHLITKNELNQIIDCLEFRASVIIKQCVTLQECGVKDTKSYETEAEKCFALANKLKLKNV